MLPAPAHVRALRREDIGRLVRLWEEAGLVPVGPDGLTVDEAVDTTLAEGAVALVVDRDGVLVGAGCGAVFGPIGLLLRLVVAPGAHEDSLARLLDALEVSLIERGARKARLWLALDPLLTNMLADRGYVPLPGTVVLERALSPIA
ncbi:MAG: hypothetical protein M3517_03475, partial [Actinomycetota bacterium]|nr:hypothetical protein [Actinomycetota bacterium]